MTDILGYTYIHLRKEGLFFFYLFEYESRVGGEGFSVLLLL